MELNPGHPIVARLYDRYQANNEDPSLDRSVELLFETALIAEGSEIADPVRLKNIVLELLQQVV